MPVYTADQIPGIGDKFLESYTKGEFHDISRSNQFSVFGRHFESKLAVKAKSTAYTFNYKDRIYSNVRHRAMDQEDSVNRENIGAKGSIEIGFQDTHYWVNELEPCWSADGSTQETEIINYLGYEAQNMEDAFYEEADANLCQLRASPNDGSSGPVYPHSIPYWVNNATANSDGAFTASMAGSYSAIGGLSRTTYTGLNNYKFTWGSVSPDDFMRKAFLAMMETNFKPYYTVASRNAKEVVPEQRHIIFSDMTTFADYRQNTFGMNENFGSDLGKFQTDTKSNVWASVNWEWIPAQALGGTSVRQVWGLDLSTWDFVQYGPWFKKRQKMIRGGAHNQYVAWMDSAWTTCCKNPRANFAAVPNLT